jgi:hypothetical protein
MGRNRREVLNHPQAFINPRRYFEKHWKLGYANDALHGIKQNGAANAAPSLPVLLL